MKYIVTCPFCGYRLLRAEEGSLVEMYCAKCKEEVEVTVAADSVHVGRTNHNKVQKALEKAAQ